MSRAILHRSIGVLVALIAFTASSSLAKDVDLSAGNKAPSFTATRLDGKTVHFPGDFKGKVVMVDFWATWCGPCVGEIPNVVSNYQKYHSKGFAILSISLDRPGSRDHVQQFVKEHNMSWMHVWDGKFWQAAVAQLYGIQSIPHMILVDGDTGVILADNPRGPKLEPAIKKALAEKHVQ